MRTAFAPVEAGSAQRPPGEDLRFEIDPEITEEAPTFVGDKAGSVGEDDIVAAAQGVRHGQSKPAGHMIVAGARDPQGLVARTDRAIAFRTRGGDRHQRMNGMRDFGR